MTKSIEEMPPTSHSFNKALDYVIDDLKGWRNIHTINHKRLLEGNNYTYPKEATREHENKIRFIEMLIYSYEERKVK